MAGFRRGGTMVQRDAECDIREDRRRQPTSILAKIAHPNTGIYMICIYK